MKIAARIASVALAATMLAVPSSATAGETAGRAYSDPVLNVIQPKARVLRPGCAGPGNIIRIRLNNKASTVDVDYYTVVRKNGRRYRYVTNMPAGWVGVIKPTRLFRKHRSALVIVRAPGIDGALAKRRVYWRPC